MTPSPVDWFCVGVLTLLAKLYIHHIKEKVSLKNSIFYHVNDHRMRNGLLAHFNVMHCLQNNYSLPYI